MGNDTKCKNKTRELYMKKWKTIIVITDPETGEILNELEKDEYQIIGEKIICDTNNKLKTITKLARRTNTKQLKLNV